MWRSRVAQIDGGVKRKHVLGGQGGQIIGVTTYSNDPLENKARYCASGERSECEVEVIAH
jgi:hypothetical protein